jgi:hypothetical protein
MSKKQTNILLAILLIVIGAGTRIVNHQYHLHNIAPLAAIGLFSGSVIRQNRVLAFLAPLLAQFLADLYFQAFTTIPGFYGTSQISTYLALVSATILGLVMGQPKAMTALAYTFGASTLFYMVSNLGYFAEGWNGYSFSGLIKTYVDGIPFFKYTILGDMIGGTVLFGAHFLYLQARPKPVVR